jgi:exonuclease 3'-5' domain-containing protein 1
LLEGRSTRKASSVLVEFVDLSLRKSDEQVFWDVRTDSDALFSHFSIRLQNVYDLQVLELVWRRMRGERTRYLCGLAQSMSRLGLATPSWKRVKETGVALFAPEKGGSYEIFERRPLDARIVYYCAQDIALLPNLEETMRHEIEVDSKRVDRFVNRESADRVEDSQTVVRRGKRPHMALVTVKWYRF